MDQTGDDHISDDGRDDSKRTRNPTQKGSQYNLKLCESSIQTAFRKLKHQSRIIDGTIFEYGSFQTIVSLYKEWMTLSEDFFQLHDRYSSFVSYGTDAKSFDTEIAYISSYKSTVLRWIANNEHQQPVLRAGDSVSNVGSNVAFKTVSETGRSSLACSVTSAKLREEQNRVEILAKASVLKEKHELELEKLKLKLKQEELDIKTDLAVSNARTQVLSKYEDHDSDNDIEHAEKQSQVAFDMLNNDSKQRLSYSPGLMGTYQPKGKQSLFNDRSHSFSDHAQHDIKPTQTKLPHSSAYQLNPSITPFEPQFPSMYGNNNPISGNSTGGTANVNNMSHELIESLVKNFRKPAPEIKQFSGDPMEYRKFMRQFKNRIIINCQDDDEKMGYLEQFACGEAYRIISGYSYLDARIGYPAALNELEDRYGNEQVLANAFVKRALDWPCIKPDNAKGLDDFAIFLSECENAVQGISAVKVLEYPDNIRRLVGKLPFYMHDKWRGIVERFQNSGLVPFSQLVKFVKTQAKRLTDPMYGKDALRVETSQATPGFRGQTQRRQFVQKSSFTVNSANPSQMSRAPESDEGQIKDNAFSNPCLYCKMSNHSLVKCISFSKLVHKEKIDFLRLKGLCFLCFHRGHLRKDCRCKVECSKCKGRHQTVCHFERDTNFVQSESPIKSVDSNSSSRSEVASSCMGAGDGECTLAIIPVKVKFKDGLSLVDTYAFLDPGSSVSFCSEKLMSKLGVSGPKMKIKLDTMGSSHTLSTHAIKGMQVCDLSMQNIINLPRLYSKDKIPVNHSHIPKHADIKQWDHLGDVHLPQIDGDIDLLIGNNVPDVFTPLEVRTGPEGSPHATLTRMGWVVWNVVRTDGIPDFSVNRIEVTKICEIDRLDQLVKQSINFDFPERITDDQKECSVEDKQFIQKVDDSMKFVDGHYEISLPFRDQTLHFPNNRFQASQRLQSLRRKLQANSKFHDDYNTFMSRLISDGYAERVPDCELQRPDGEVWYIPHHGVYHPRKPDKVRVVFDCTASLHGVSLNNLLLQGPDLTNGLLGVLLRFRQESIAVMGDIEAMFYQVKVPKFQSDLLRFLWWPDGDVQQDPVEYRMLVHLFVAASSPSCSNRALQKTVEDNADDYETTIIDVARRCFYVDDCLASVSTVDQAKALVSCLSSLCKCGGFNLSKWVSNSHEVLESVPVEHRAKDIQALDLISDQLPNERALGVYWIVQSDTLGFRIQLCDQSPTRRTILSVVSSVYDPLGLISPFILTARIILQSLCQKALDWDQMITGEDLRKWQQWVDDLSHLDKLELNRCYVPAGFGKVVSYQLHMFSDASDVGYGVAAYVRMTNERNENCCSLVMGKSRVAPLKKVTIPRMELTAAVVAVRISRILVKELEYPINDIHFWTDSMSVLKYIFNRTARFHTFVANRVAVIHDGSDVNQWHYVDSKSNPADAASRGLKWSKLLKARYWFEGSEFLGKPESEWPVPPDSPTELTVTDPEVKVVHATVSEPSFLDVLVSRCGSWWRLRRVVGWILMFVNGIRRRIKQRKGIANEMPVSGSECHTTQSECNQFLSRGKASVCPGVKPNVNSMCLDADVFYEAESCIVKYVQHQYFCEEMGALKTGQVIKRSSPLCKLDIVFVDGLLRVGGRLDRAAIPYDSKHPVILPKGSPVSRLVLEEVHRFVGHSGRNTMLATLRQKYWVLGASALIKTLLFKCVVCRRYRANRGEQKMADLPGERLVPYDPPFTRVGVDYFGPFVIKRGRSLVKRYGVIFTCMSSRAVHLEIAHSMDTDSCINALRRFISRRGPVKIIRSDNGSNLVSTNRILKEEIAKWNQSRINDAMLQKGIKWEFNPPSGSHFGGVWERMIRSVRKILYGLLHQQSSSLCDEGLQTLFCEVEAILNSRPLTCTPNDSSDCEALTPNHLLLQQPGLCLPPGVFSKEDNFVRRKWRQIQYLTDIFWKRWLGEYLPLLQVRQKWLRPHRNVMLNDVVLIADSSVRSSWTLGRVMEVFKDSKGFVRSVMVKTKSGVFRHPIDKLCLILEADE